MRLSIQRNGQDFLTYNWARGWIFCDYQDEGRYPLDRNLLSPSAAATSNGRQIVSALGSANFTLIETAPLEHPEPRPCYLPTAKKRETRTERRHYSPPKPVTTIGITGHRHFEDKRIMERQKANINSLMNQIKGKYPDATIITGGAVGIDMIAAENAIQHNLTSKVILPMHPSIFTANWGKENKKRLASILLASEVEIIRNGKPWIRRYDPDTQTPAEFFASMPKKETKTIVFAPDTNLIECLNLNDFYDFRFEKVVLDPYEYETLQERNEAIVDQSSILLAFYDGRGEGGSYNCLKYALKQSPDDITIINGITSEIMLPETPIADYFSASEPCIEGCEQLQARIGYEKYATHYLSADYFSDNNNIFGIHEIISDPEIETGVAARVYASVSNVNPMIQKQDAITAANLIVGFGIEHERYWTNLLKSDFNKTVAELQQLTDALAECETPDTDVLMIKGYIPREFKDVGYSIVMTAPEDNTYDGVATTATYGFHQIDDQFNHEPIAPPKTRKPTKSELKRNPQLADADIEILTGNIVKPNPRQQAKNALLAQIRELDGKELLTFGRDLYHQKAQYPEMNYQDWLELWTAYNDRKKVVNVISENGFRGTARPSDYYPQVRRGKQLFAVQFPSGKWEFAQKELDTDENKAILQLVIWDRLHADWADNQFTIKNRQAIDYTFPIHDVPNIMKDRKAWSLFNEPERNEIKMFYGQDITDMIANDPHRLINHLNETFQHDYKLVKGFDDVPEWILEIASNNIIIPEPETPEPETPACYLCDWSDLCKNTSEINGCSKYHRTSRAFDEIELEFNEQKTNLLDNE